MYIPSEIIAEYGITENVLKEYIDREKIPLTNEGEISKKHFQSILNFIENADDRIEKSLEGKQRATFNYNFGKNKLNIYKDDAISFLKKLPSNSVDLIVTDPAYSGMNNKLKLGKGRIVGNYSEKGEKEGKWFGEFEDSEGNYTKFYLNADEF